MAIHTGLIPAMEIDNIHDITVITDCYEHRVGLQLLSAMVW